MIALRNRLPVNQAAHLGAQLPMLLRGSYYEGWKPAAVPQKYRSHQEFLDKNQEYLMDKEPELNPQHIAESVFKVLTKCILEGQVTVSIAMRIAAKPAALRNSTPISIL